MAPPLHTLPHQPQLLRLSSSPVTLRRRWLLGQQAKSQKTPDNEVLLIPEPLCSSNHGIQGRSNNFEYDCQKVR